MFQFIWNSSIKLGQKCRYMADVQPLSLPPKNHAAAAGVGTETAAELLIQRFATPGSSGIPEVLSTLVEFSPIVPS